MRVRLETSRQELVHETDIPQFNEPPDYIVWGSRFFLFHDASVQEGGDVFAVYTELDFGYVLPDQAQARQTH